MSDIARILELAAELPVGPWFRHKNLCAGLVSAQGNTDGTHGVTIANVIHCGGGEETADKILEYISLLAPDKIQGVIAPAPIIGMKEAALEQALRRVLTAIDRDEDQNGGLLSRTTLRTASEARQTLNSTAKAN
jgi:hypothetical protein